MFGKRSVSEKRNADSILGLFQIKWVLILII